MTSWLGTGKSLTFFDSVTVLSSVIPLPEVSNFFKKLTYAALRAFRCTICTSELSSLKCQNPCCVVDLCYFSSLWPLLPHSAVPPPSPTHPNGPLIENKLSFASSSPPPFFSKRISLLYCTVYNTHVCICTFYIY